MEEMEASRICICTLQEKMRGKGIFLGCEHLVFNQKQHIEIGRKCWMTFKREWWRGCCEQKSGKIGGGRGGYKDREREIADEREGEKWLIFALSDASGICVTMLPHLSSLSDLTARAIKGGVRERTVYTEIKSVGKRGEEKSNRLRETQKETEELLEWVYKWERGENHSPGADEWMPESRGQLRAESREVEGVRRQKGKPESRCVKDKRVITWFWTVCLSLLATLDSSLHSQPCVLVREEGEIVKAVCMDGWKKDGRERKRQRQRYERGQAYILTRLKANTKLTPVDQPRSRK